MDTKHPICKHEMLTHGDSYNITYSNDPSPQKYTCWWSRSYMGATSYLFISFAVHVNQIIHFWDMAILRICLENLRSESWLGSKVKLIYRHYETHSCWICYEKGEGSVKLLDITGNLYITWHPEMAKTWCTKLWSEQFGDNSSFGFFLKLNMWHTLLI